tara:strand:- start:4 stop:993 length:990 start_codon:yes stop_codon:yes gene_type:complete
MTWQDTIKKEDSPLFDASKMIEWLNGEGDIDVNFDEDMTVKTASINFTKVDGRNIGVDGEFDYSGNDESGKKVQGKGTYSIRGKSKRALEGMFHVWTGTDGISFNNPIIRLDGGYGRYGIEVYDLGETIKIAVTERVEYILEHQHLLRRESEAVPDYGQRGVHTKDYSPKNKKDRWQDVMRNKTHKEGFTEAYQSNRESERREIPLSIKRIEKMIEVFGDEVKIENDPENQKYNFSKTIPFEDNAIYFDIDESSDLTGLTAESSNGSKYGITLLASFKLPKGVGFVHGNDSRTAGRKQPDGEQRKAFVKDFAKYKAMSEKDLFFLLLKA